MKASPTKRTYKTLDDAYGFFNKRLFDGKLPGCLVTLQRGKGLHGYFAGDRFGLADGGEVTDEIALNPSHFHNRTTEAILSTLVHEMTHLQQHHFGKPSRTSYHNKEWAQMMRAVGLIPSDTGNPGGREVGQAVSHYVEPDGHFEKACEELINGGFKPFYGDLWADGEAARRKQKRESKTRYTCNSCRQNAWANPNARLVCGFCASEMRPPENDDET
jgi:predicted SprT family Zn-dependent metalloprotease